MLELLAKKGKHLYETLKQVISFGRETNNDKN